MSDSAEERNHWQSVIKAFDGYMQYHLSANHARRMAFLQLPKEQRTVYEAIGFREKLDAVDEGIRRNAEFIDEMIRDPVFADMLDETDPEQDAGIDSDHSHSHSHGDHGHSHAPSQPHSHHAHSHDAGSSGAKRQRSSSPTQANNDLAQDKIRSTLRSFVRDWAEEGAGERAACYAPILEALERHFPRSEGRDRGSRKVLVPGCGLGRLAMEIAARGFFSQGNEFSTYMLIASHFVLNQTSSPGSHSIFPYLHSYSNHLTTGTHLLRRVLIPDVVPADVLNGKGGEFSLVAGDFEEIYGEQSWDVAVGVEGEQGQRGKWAAVVTCFFIDCSRNILSFLRIIHALLEEDGVWINLGPLLWHFENSPTKSAKGEGSIELSLDEVKELARAVGFDIHEETMVETTYTGIPEGMLQHRYNAAYWTATKRKTDA